VLFSLVYFLLRHLLRVPSPGRDRERELELELLVLRHELAVLKRKADRPKLRRSDKVLLTALSRLLPRERWSSFIVTPGTLLRWHRELVKRKWTHKTRRAGRPPLDPKLAALIVRMAGDNPRWGYLRIKGECQKLGLRVSATRVKKVLLAAGLDPAPRRDGPSWSEFLRSQAEGIIACDFFTVETVFLKTLYVLFFIEVGSRRLHVTMATANPTGAFVTQQARNLCYALDEREEPVRFLVHDRDAKFSCPFDEVFRTEGIRVIRTPVRAPRANAFAERFVRTVRGELLDLTLICGRRHLDHMLRRYTDHYNESRPHRGLDLRTPAGVADREFVPDVPTVRRIDVLGGLISEYEPVAA
jgi:transposase InsO family protein